jgi:tetratricopeptide (TPR) repeat protein
MECSVFLPRAQTTSKVLRSQELFDEARKTLESCLEHPLQGPSRPQFICQLADVYVELDLPRRASELLVPEIEMERKKAKKSKALRRFLVSATDSYIQSQCYGNAIATAKELNSIFDELRYLDVSDELLHIRVVVASARMCYSCSQFTDSIRYWQYALRLVRDYKSFKDEGFTYAVIQLSMSLAYLELGLHDEAKSSFDSGKAVWPAVERDYWIPKFAVWSGTVISEIKSLTSWEIQ